MRIQIYIDPELHPALHSTLEREKNAKRRAALVKAFAERHLTGIKKPPASTGPFCDGGTYGHIADKCHDANSALTDNSPISADTQNVALIGDLAISAKDSQPSAQPGGFIDFELSRRADSKELNAQPDLALSGNMPLSAKSTGADALVSVLSDQMLGIRR